MLGSLKEERMRPKGAKDYKRIVTPAGSGAETSKASAPRDGSQILKGSGWVFSGRGVLWAGPHPGQVLRGRIKV